MICLEVTVLKLNLQTFLDVVFIFIFQYLSHTHLEVAHYSGDVAHSKLTLPSDLRCRPFFCISFGELSCAHQLRYRYRTPQPCSYGGRHAKGGTLKYSRITSSYFLRYTMTLLSCSIVASGLFSILTFVQHHALTMISTNM